MLEITRDGAVATLSIDRSEVRNAMSVGLARKIAAVTGELDLDENVRAIVLRGKEHGFCAGSDLKELSSFNLDQIAAAEREKAAVARSFCFMKTPVIAAVDGFTMGGGMVFTVSCDVVFTSKTARWHLPEVALGWNPGWGVQAFLARCGPVVTRHVCWGVDPFDGKEAVRLGLADFLAANDAATAAAEYAAKLANLPPHAVAATKRLCAPAAGENGQVLDLMANDLFHESCRHETAKASYARFGIKI
jgi:enoyl-CoA hydratase/carnithine racemase